jgi:hypothetical protein
MKWFYGFMIGVILLSGINAYAQTADSLSSANGIRKKSGQSLKFPGAEIFFAGRLSG